MGWVFLWSDVSHAVEIVELPHFRVVVTVEGSFAAFAGPAVSVAVANACAPLHALVRVQVIVTSGSVFLASLFAYWHFELGPPGNTPTGSPHPRVVSKPFGWAACGQARVIVQDAGSGSF